MFRSILFIALLSIPSLASAQQWQVAYSNGTYRWDAAKCRWNFYPNQPNYSTTTDNHSVTQTFTYNFQMPTQPYAQQGNTLYGLGTLPTVDGEAFIERAYRLQERVQESAAAGYHAFLTTGTSVLSSQADLADQEARKELIKALGTFLESTKGQQKVQAASSAQVDPAGQAVKIGSAQGVFSRHCGECHTGPKAKGGLDLSDIAKLAPEQIQKAMQRMASTDKNRMPPPPAAAVPADEVLVVLRAALGVE